MLNLSNLCRQLITISLLMVSLSSCFQLFGDNPVVVVKEVYNIKKTKNAILFMNEGNATTNNSLHVSIESAGEEINSGETGNIFIVDSDHGLVKLDSTAITLNWLNEETLQISYNKKLRTFKKSNEEDGVNVSYKTW